MVGITGQKRGGEEERRGGGGVEHSGLVMVRNDPSSHLEHMMVK